VRLRDKIVIITGAASGIGRATALLFASEGARLVLNDIDRQRLEAVLDQLGKGKHRAVDGSVWRRKRLPADWPKKRCQRSAVSTCSSTTPESISSRILPI